MFQRRIPEWLRHAPAPSVRGFAVLAGVESAARGILVSVYPIAMYRTFGDSRTVSEIYFLIGIGSLITVLLVPWLIRFVPRRRMYTLGVMLLIAGGVCSALGGPMLLPLGLAGATMATVIMFVCFNAYVLDYVERASLGESETLRLLYSGAAWTAGPFLGVWLMKHSAPAPFILSAVAATILLTLFMLRWMRARSVRRAVRVGFFGSAAAFGLAAVLGGQPVFAIALLMVGSFYLILLDMCGGLPFLMAVKPSERTEMSAIYATCRDVSGVLTPGVARLVLAVAPLPAVFAATAIGLAGALVISSWLNLRLGLRRAFGV